MQTYIISSHFFLVRLYIISSFHQIPRSFMYSGLCFSINLSILQTRSNFQIIQDKQLSTLLPDNYRGNHSDMQNHYLQSITNTVSKYSNQFFNLVKCRTFMASWSSWWVFVSIILHFRLFLISYLWEKVQFYFVGWFFPLTRFLLDYMERTLRIICKMIANYFMFFILISFFHRPSISKHFQVYYHW